MNIKDTILQNLLQSEAIYHELKSNKFLGLTEVVSSNIENKIAIVIPGRINLILGLINLANNKDIYKPVGSIHEAIELFRNDPGLEGFLEAIRSPDNKIGFNPALQRYQTSGEIVDIILDQLRRGLELLTSYVALRKVDE